MRSTISAVLVLLLVLGIGKSSAAAETYWIKEINPGYPIGSGGTALGINDSGQVIGWGFGSGWSWGFLYDGTNIIDLHARSHPNSINAAGHVVGVANDPLPSGSHKYPFLYDVGGMHDLTALLGFDAAPYGINDLDQCVGGAHEHDFIVSDTNQFVGGAHEHAFLVSGGALQDLGTLGSTFSSARAINNAGQIAGYSWIIDPGGRAVSHAFLLTPKDADGDGKPDVWFEPDPTNPERNLLMKDLGTLGGSNSRATAINAAGHVVGISDLPGDASQHAFLYDESGIHDLGSLADSSSDAVAINSRDQVVGYSKWQTLGVERPCLWSGGQIEDLSRLILPGCDLVPTEATGINDRGQISSWGQGGNLRALVLTPISVALPSAPAAPSDLRVSAPSKTGLTLDWAATGMAQDSTRATGFEIERSTAGGPFSLIQTVAASVTSFTDTGLTPGTTYTYRVRTTNAGGASDPSNESSATTLPVALTTFTLSPDTLTGSATAQGTVTLDYPAPAGGAVVSLVNPNKALLFLPANLTVPEGKTSAAFSVATQSVTELQTLAIAARYGDVTLSATLTLLPPVTVAALTLQPNPATAGRFCTGTVTLSAPTPATGAVVSLESDDTDVATVPPGVKLSPGTTSATFQVTTRAITTASQATITATLAGTKQSATLQVVLPSEAPVGPTNLLVGDATPTNLTLAWVDNSATATGFEIERRTSDTPFSRIWELGADATKFTDPGVAPTTTYIYRVRAVNSAGVSTYSNEASATTLATGLAFLTLTPDAITGGDTSTGTLTLNGPAPAGGAVVSLTSSNPLVARVPQTLLIPAGATWTRFTVTSSLTANPATITLSAHYAGAVQTATLAVLPSTTLGSAILAPLRASGTRHIAVMRPSTHEWFLRQPDGSLSVIQWGGPDDLPVPADYFGAGQPQIAVLRPATHEWILRQLDGGAMRVQWGGPGDLPVPADYLGTGRAQIAVLRPSTHEWFIRRDDGSLLHFQFGGPEDVPVPADYFGVGRAQIAVYRPSTSEWFLVTPEGGVTRTQWGTWLDRPVPGDYLGERKAQIAIYRPSTSEFFIRKGNGQLEHVQFGMQGDEPVSYDFGDSGKRQIGIYRPGTGEWFVQQESGGAAKVPWGGWGDVPVPGAFSPR